MSNISKGNAGNCAWCGKHFIAKIKGQLSCGTKACAVMIAKKKKLDSDENTSENDSGSPLGYL